MEKTNASDSIAAELDMEAKKEVAFKRLMESTEKLLDQLERGKNLIFTEFESEIKKYGNSAHIPIQKKYIGRMVNVQIFKTKEEVEAGKKK